MSKIWLHNAWGKRSQNIMNSWKKVFDSKDGRDILYDLALYCRINKTSFVPNDPHQTAFNEGSRDVFLHICSMLSLSHTDITNIISGEQR